MAQTALYNPTAVWVKPSDVIHCASCATAFWMSEVLRRQLVETHRNFYCPVGHENYWPQESTAERERRLRKAAEDRLASTISRLDQAEASRRAYKGQATKMRNQALAGACPLCGASVYQMARHMSRVHADEAHSPSDSAQDAGESGG